jgi:hypothetical protein
MAVTNQARIWAIMAASGTGKGVWLKGRLKAERPERLIVWDFMAEYGDHAKPSASLAAIHKAMTKAGGAGPLRLAYTHASSRRCANSSMPGAIARSWPKNSATSPRQAGRRVPGAR